MKVIKLFFLIISFSLQSQNNKVNPLKFQGEIKGIFEIIEIDSTGSENKIKLKLLHLLNSKDFPTFNNTSPFFAIVISKKKNIRQKNKLKELNKLIIGREYYFDLLHVFFYKSLYSGPNTIPYAYNLDGKRIWEEANDYGLYTSNNLIGLFYK